jgi:hypothetical protein
MPVKRRVPKRRIAELPDACWRHLCDLAEPGDAGSDELIGFEYFDDPLSIEEAWARYGVAAVAAHQAVHGRDSYPGLWWRFNAPDDGGGDGPGGGGELPRVA